MDPQLLMSAELLVDSCLLLSTLGFNNLSSGSIFLSPPCQEEFHNIRDKAGVESDIGKALNYYNLQPLSLPQDWFTGAPGSWKTFLSKLMPGCQFSTVWWMGKEMMERLLICRCSVQELLFNDAAVNLSFSFRTPSNSWLAAICSWMPLCSSQAKVRWIRKEVWWWCNISRISSLYSTIMNLSWIS